MDISSNITDFDFTNILIKQLNETAMSGCENKLYVEELINNCKKDLNRLEEQATHMLESDKMNEFQNIASLSERLWNALENLKAVQDKNEKLNKIIVEEKEKKNFNEKKQNKREKKEKKKQNERKKEKEAKEAKEEKEEKEEKELKETYKKEKKKKKSRRKSSETFLNLDDLFLEDKMKKKKEKYEKEEGEIEEKRKLEKMKIRENSNKKKRNINMNNEKYNDNPLFPYPSRSSNNNVKKEKHEKCFSNFFAFDNSNDDRAGKKTEKEKKVKFKENVAKNTVINVTIHDALFLPYTINRTFYLRISTLRSCWQQASKKSIKTCNEKKSRRSKKEKFNKEECSDLDASNFQKELSAACNLSDHNSKNSKYTCRKEKMNSSSVLSYTTKSAVCKGSGQCSWNESFELVYTNFNLVDFILCSSNQSPSDFPIFALHFEIVSSIENQSVGFADLPIKFVQENKEFSHSLLLNFFDDSDKSNRSLLSVTTAIRIVDVLVSTESFDSESLLSENHGDIIFFNERRENYKIEKLKNENKKLRDENEVLKHKLISQQQDIIMIQQTVFNLQEELKNSRDYNQKIIKIVNYCYGKIRALSNCYNQSVEVEKHYNQLKELKNKDANEIEKLKNIIEEFQEKISVEMKHREGYKKLLTDTRFRLFLEKRRTAALCGNLENVSKLTEMLKTQIDLSNLYQQECENRLFEMNYLFLYFSRNGIWSVYNKSNLENKDNCLLQNFCDLKNRKKFLTLENETSKREENEENKQNSEEMLLAKNIKKILKSSSIKKWIDVPKISMSFISEDEIYRKNYIDLLSKKEGTLYDHPSVLHIEYKVIKEIEQEKKVFCILICSCISSLILQKFQISLQKSMMPGITATLEEINPSMPPFSFYFSSFSNFFSSLSKKLPNARQISYLLQMSVYQPFVDPPLLQIFYLLADNNSKNVKLRIPLPCVFFFEKEKNLILNFNILSNFPSFKTEFVCDLNSKFISVRGDMTRLREVFRTAGNLYEISELFSFSYKSISHLIFLGCFVSNNAAQSHYNIFLKLEFDDAVSFFRCRVTILCDHSLITLAVQKFVLEVFATKS